MSKTNEVFTNKNDYKTQRKIIGVLKTQIKKKGREPYFDEVFILVLTFETLGVFQLKLV